MYRIIVKKKAKKFIDKLPMNERKRIAYAIEQLPNGEDIKKLKGHDDLLRLRVDEYRIIYSVDNGELIVYVVDAGNRGDIYKRYKQGAIKITVRDQIKAACDMAGISKPKFSIDIFHFIAYTINRKSCDFYQMVTNPYKNRINRGYRSLKLS